MSCQNVLVMVAVTMEGALMFTLNVCVMSHLLKGVITCTWVAML